MHSAITTIRNVATAQGRRRPDADTNAAPEDILFLGAVALALSTLMGLWIGLTRPGRLRTGRALLAAGTIIPAALLMT